VDAEKLPESRKLATVDNLPTFAAFEGGVLKNRFKPIRLKVLTIFSVN
jgi:hypothetical protein